MATNNKITVGVEYQLNQAKFNEIMSALEKIQLMSSSEYMSINKGLKTDEAKKQLNELRPIITKVREDLTKAFNTNIGVVNISKFNQELNNSKLNLNQVYKALQNYGTAGQIAFRNLSIGLATQNLQLKESHTLLDKMSQTMANTVRYGISSSVFNTLTNRLQQSYEFSKQLNTSLNDIRIVTDKSADDMERFAVQANKAAQALGKTTQDYAKASLIYYQQGLSDEETRTRTNVTLKTANVTGQNPSDVSEQLTAVWNGYKITTEETEVAIDKLAAVAAGTAADLEELTTGMSKVASAGNLMGVSLDQLNAQLATIVSVTRQAPESIGTALKTIYGRISDIQAGVDEEVTLGNYTSKMAAMGVNVLDATGKLRDMGEVIEEIGNKWDTMSREQQVALTKLMGGTRQYNNLLALFDNWDMYLNTIKMSKEATGTLQKQQDIYMESTAAHLEQLQSAWEKLFITIFDAKGLNGLIDGLTNVVGLLGDFSQAVGGGGKSLLALGAIGTQIMGKQITQGISTTLNNFDASHDNKVILDNDRARINELGSSLSQEDPVIQKATEDLKLLADSYKYLNEQQINEQKNAIMDTVRIQNEITQWEDRKNAVLNFASAISGMDVTNVYDLLDINEDTMLGDAFTLIQESLHDMYSSIKDFNKGMKDTKVTADEEAQKFKKILEIVKQLKDQNIDVFNGADKEKWEQKYAKYSNKTDAQLDQIFKTAKGSDAATEFVKEVERSAEKISQAAKDMQEMPDQFTDGSMKKLNDDLNAAEGRVKSFREQLKNLNVAEVITNLTSGTTQLASAFSTFANIPNIFNNQDLSTGEKFTQILMALGTATSTAITGFQNFAKGIKNFPLLLTKMKVGIISLLPAYKGMTTAEIEAAIAAGTLKVAMAEILLPILAVVAVIGLLVGAVYLAVKAWNKDAEAAENAAKNLEAVTEAYNKAKEAADNLKESISNYNEALESLEKLRKGTEEYAKALEKANEEAKKLIETYGLYDDYYYENGIIKFNDGVLEGAQARADKAVDLLGKERYAAQGNAAQARLTSNITNLARSVDWDAEWEHVAGGLQRDEAVDILSKLKNTKDTDEKEYINITKSSKAFEEWITKTYEGTKRMEVLADEVGKSVSGFKALVSETEEVEKSLDRYAKQINLVGLNSKYGNQISNIFSDKGLTEQALNLFNNTAVEKEITSLKESYRNENTPLKYWETNHGDSFADVGTWGEEFATYNLNTMVTDILKKTGSTEKELLDLFGTTELKEDQSLADAWAKVNNIDLSKAYFKDGKYINDAGETLVDVSNSESRAQKRKTLVDIGLNEHLDNALDSGESIQKYEQKIVNMFQNLSEKAKEGGRKFGTDFTSSALNYLSNPDKELDLSSLAGEITPSERDRIEMMSNEEVSNLFGLTPDVLKQWTEKTANQVGWDLKNAIHNVPWDIDKAINKEFANIQDTLPEDLSNKKFAKYTEDLKDYTKYLMEISDATEDAADDSNDLADSMKEDAKAGVLVANSIARMNSGIDKLADNQEDWIKTLKKSSIESKEYYNALTGLRDAFEDLFDLSEDTADRLDGSFFQENAELIEQAATGSEEAIEKLRNAASETIFVDILIDNKIFGEEYNRLQSNLEALQNEIPDIVVGTNINFDDLDTSHDDFLNSCQDIIESAHMTADQARAFLESIGFEPTFKMTEEKREVQKPITVTDTIDESYTNYDGPEPVFHEKKRTYSYVDGYTPVEEKYLVPAMSSDGSDPTPTITSLIRKGTGSFNNYSSKNKGGGSPGKGSKGGGSSKKSKIEEHEKKEADIYHEIDNQIKLVTTDLQRLQKVQDKVFGTDAIKNLNEQYAILGKQANNYRQKMTIAEGEYDKLRKELEQAGVIFTSDGLVADYVQTMDNILAEYNKKVDEYNALSEEEKEKWDEENILKNAKEEMEKKREKIDRIDTIKVDLMPGLKDAIKEIERQQISIKIKNFNMEVDLRLEMKDALKDWDSFRKEVLDDWDELWEKESFSEGFFDKDGKWNSNLMRTAKEDFDLLRGYFDKEFTSMSDGSTIYGSGLVGAQTEHLNELINEANKAFAKNTDGLFADETQTAIDNLKKYKEEAMTTARDIKQKIEDIKSLYLNTLKEASEKFKEQADMISRVGKLLDHDAKLIKLIYGDDQYESLAKYYQKQHDNNIQQLDFSKRQVDFWKNQMDLAKENSDEWRYAKEQWLSAIDQASSDLEAAVETAKEKWENAIDNVFDKLDKKFTDGLGLDYIKEEWTLINKNSDQYLDSINAAYGIQKLQNKYLDAIDKSDDVGNQRRLNELMNSQINELQQIDRLTQTDLERAELKYQIALKQMELEDAQNAKTTMRLRRDSQGNYTYQFVANEDNINKAKEELEDLKNQLYNFDLKAYRNNLDQAATAYEEYMSKMAEAAKIVDPEERAAKEKLIQEEYQEYVNMLTDENERYRNNLIESAIDEKIELNQLEKEDFINATDEKIDKVMNDLVPQWDSGVQSMIDKWSGSEGFKETTEAAINELMDKDEEYRKDIDEIQKTADVDFGLIKESMNDARVEALEPYIQKNDELVNAYEAQVKYIRDTLIPQLKGLEDQYWDLVAAIEAANAAQGIEYESAADEAGKEREKIYNDLNPTEEAKPVVIAEEETPSDNSGSDASSGNGGRSVAAGQVIAGFTGKYYYDSYGTDPAGIRKSGKAVKVDNFSSVDYGGTQKTGSYAIHISDAETGGHLGWVRPEDLEGFGTGGYTGAWGDSGRLAMLHQKELVLNAEDTGNFLNALDIMRNIVNNIGSEAFSRLASIGGNRIGDPAFAGIEQNVVINADFPNATDHNEIQQAFDNLLNIASQRVNRNRM